ncbi:MAG: hypothetical protein DMF51_09620 [Acidobacteria bacterium]|nr:MAG: hypothetical protein DMF51_09620 [Acidobacteriota bacterium]
MSSIGRYEIERELGRGAMGVVYLARDPRLHRQVAVKTYSLPDGISEELAKEFHERFLREARAAASLSHPGIVTVYDAGDDPGRGIPYIAMEFVQGQSLKQRLEKGDRRRSPAPGPPVRHHPSGHQAGQHFDPRWGRCGENRRFRRRPPQDV